MADTFEGLTVKFSANTVEFDASVKGMSKALTGLRKEFSTLSKEAKFNPKNLETYKKQLVNLQEQARVSELKIKELIKQQKALGEEKVGTQKWNNLQLEIDKTKGKLKIINREIETTNKSIKDLDPRSVKSLEKQFENLAGELEIVDKRLKLDPKNTELINQKIEILNRQLNNTTARAATLREELNRVSAKGIDSEEVEKLRKRLNEAGLEAEGLKVALEKVDPKSLSNIGKSVQGLGAKMTDIGKKTSLFITAPIVAGFTAAIKAGNDFEYEISRVGAIAGATRKEIELLSNKGTELGAKTKYSAVQAAEGMENLATAGFSVEEIMSAIPGVLDLAAVSGDDVALSAKNMAGAIRGFGLSAEESTHVADVFAKATVSTNAGLQTMGDAMKYVAPISKSLGLSLEETAASIGIMADADLEGSQAGTTLRGALIRIVKPTAAAQKEMDRLGLSFFDTNGNIKSMEEIVSMLQESMKDLTRAQRSEAMATIFGTEAVSGMLDLVDAGPERMAELTKSFKGADGAAKAMAKQMQDNVKSAIGILLSNLESLSINIQQKLAPILIKVINLVTSLIQKFLSLGPVMQKIILAIVGIAASIGPLLIGLGSLMNFVGRLIPGLTKLIPLFKILTSGFSSILSIVPKVIGVLKLLWGVLMGNPIILIITLIAALVANLVYFFTKTETGQKILKKFIDWIRSSFAVAIKWLGEVFKNVGNTIGTVWNFIKNKFSSGVTDIINSVKGIGSKIASFFVGIPNAIKSAIGNLGSIGKWIIDSIISGLGNLGSRIFSSIRGAFTSARNSIGNIIGNKSLGGIDGSIQRIYRIKSPRIPEIGSRSTNNTSNFNIHVNANNASGLEIAREIERVIVRRLST